ncbi:unnamed protein product, partial [Coccothraustes coccothraustes]
RDFFWGSLGLLSLEKCLSSKFCFLMSVLCIFPLPARPSVSISTALARQDRASNCTLQSLQVLQSWALALSRALGDRERGMLAGGDSSRDRGWPGRDTLVLIMEVWLLLGLGNQLWCQWGFPPTSVPAVPAGQAGSRVPSRQARHHPRGVT